MARCMRVQTCPFQSVCLHVLVVGVMAAKYILVEWESDSSVSVVPASHLKTRDGTRAWPGGVFADNILQESSRIPNMAKA